MKTLMEETQPTICTSLSRNDLVNPKKNEKGHILAFLWPSENGEKKTEGHWWHFKLASGLENYMSEVLKENLRKINSD